MFAPRFLLTEWEQVVDAWQLDSWEAYRDVARLGRKTRFEKVRAGLREPALVTYSDIFNRLASKFADEPHPPFNFAVLDEARH